MTRRAPIGRVSRAVLRHAAAAGIAITIEEDRATPWASVTYSGARHSLTIAGDARDGEAAGEATRWLASIADTEWSVPGRLIADATLAAYVREGDRFTARIELLSLEL